MTARCTAVRALVLTSALSAGVSCAHGFPDEIRDLVVFGEVETPHYEPIDEFAIDGRFTAQLTINRVVSGRPPSSVMTINYIAHSDLAADREFRFHLQRSANGTWVACNDDGGRGYICQ